MSSMSGHNSPTPVGSNSQIQGKINKVIKVFPKGASIIIIIYAYDNFYCERALNSEDNYHNFLLKSLM